MQINRFSPSVGATQDLGAVENDVRVPTGEVAGAAKTPDFMPSYDASRIAPHGDAVTPLWLQGAQELSIGNARDEGVRFGSVPEPMVSSPMWLRGLHDLSVTQASNEGVRFGLEV